MPELPEVETVCRGLAKNLTGKRIVHVVVRRGDLRKPLPRGFATTLAGAKLTHLSRRAKYILFHFEGGKVLMAHLGMSGSMVLKKGTSQTYRTHDHIIIEWEGKMQMHFHDPRRFGLMLLLDKNKLGAHPLLKDLGPEPLSEAWNGTLLYKVLRTSKAPIKSFIMDQRKVVGVGNIYAAEALFRAHIHPARAANRVTAKEATALASAIKQVLREAIASGGSTLRDYVRSSGDGGYFQHHFNVYGREGLPCPVCRKKIQVLRQSGRSTFFCGHCQK